MAGPAVTAFQGVTQARPRLAALRRFLTTEAGGAIVLLAVTLVALIWANSAFSHAYNALWLTEVSLQVRSCELGMTLGEWVNDGLMTFFFLLIGLEVRRARARRDVPPRVELILL